VGEPTCTQGATTYDQPSLSAHRIRERSIPSTVTAEHEATCDTRRRDDRRGLTGRVREDSPTDEHAYGRASNSQGQEGEQDPQQAHPEAPGAPRQEEAPAPPVRRARLLHREQ